VGSLDDDNAPVFELVDDGNSEVTGNGAEDNFDADLEDESDRRDNGND
jgi:hypothetical protein